MGAGATSKPFVRSIVADTGPVLHLHESATLDLLALAGAVTIPAAVDAELGRLIPNWSTERPDWITVSTLGAALRADADAWLASSLLDRGEAEAIALARHDHADWLLTDDAGARLVVEASGLEVHGSLGIVLWAVAIGHLTRRAAEEALDRLAQSSLWVSTAIVAAARNAVRRMFE